MIWPFCLFFFPYDTLGCRFRVGGLLEVNSLLSVLFINIYEFMNYRLKTFSLHPPEHFQGQKDFYPQSTTFSPPPSCCSPECCFLGTGCTFGCSWNGEVRNHALQAEILLSLETCQWIQDTFLLSLQNCSITLSLHGFIYIIHSLLSNSVFTLQMFKDGYR